MHIALLEEKPEMRSADACTNTIPFPSDDIGEGRMNHTKPSTEGVVKEADQS